ncbi:VOC family protein [Paenibacillus sp. TRM 82003]|nr:VOC family protein [Paenibacillus sp. TRM 82003]
MVAIIKKDLIGVMLYVRDLKKASKWYCDTLGFSIGDYDYEDFVELKLDNQYVLHLFKSEKCEPIDKAVFVFGTDDINLAHRSIGDTGVETSKIREFGDHSGFTFKDCDSNTLMICKYY